MSQDPDPDMAGELDRLRRDLQFEHAAMLLARGRAERAEATCRRLEGELQEKSEIIAQLRAQVFTVERFRAEDAYDHMQGQLLAAETHRRLEGERDQLREALRTYGFHHTRCAVRHEPLGKPCDCGLFAALSTDLIREAGTVDLGRERDKDRGVGV